MKTHRFSRARGFLPALILSAGVIAGQAVPYVVQKSGIKTDGIAIVMNPDRSVVLTTAQGVKLTYRQDQYAEVHADKPEAYVPAVKMIADGKYDEAIKAFTKIAGDYYGLEWDNIANLQIARALAGKKDYAAAIARYEDVFSQVPELKKQSEALWYYHGALLEAKQYEKLRPALKRAIAEGSHADALRAQMMRGDIEAEQGELENALLDYLRTVTFAKTGKDAKEVIPKDIVPQAMLKTAQTLERMKDGRAREWYRKLVQEYPGSPEAAAAKNKI